MNLVTTQESSKFHLVSMVISIICFLIAFYLICNNINQPVYCVVFVALILFTTNLGLYFKSINK